MSRDETDTPKHECEHLLAGAIRVLVVEDNRRVREALQRYFGAGIYDIHCVASQREAERRLKQVGGFHVCL
ncbi:MAG: hypothetical protein GF331_17055, partial [Chitinivibrionales bacterium]|nr:hypothetical protein [Chitinivibrionales bacterium]